MRIGIDARAFSHPQAGGYKTYVTNLVTALQSATDAHEYRLYLDRPVPALPVWGHVSCKTIRARGGWAGVPVREQVSLPWALGRAHLDVVHAPCATAPLLHRVPLVVTIHDAIEFLERPHADLRTREGLRRLMMAGYNRSVQWSGARRAEVVITVSEYSRADLSDVLGISRSKIVVIPNAHAPHFRRELNGVVLDRVSAHLQLPKAFILALVSASPRKNTLGLLRIYARLSTEIRARHPLVLVLTHPLLRAEIKRAVDRLGLTGSVQLLENVADQELICLYTLASVFVYPSLYEGFGLPVLEAMACGAPVVASSLTSIPEVAGDAAELVDPRDEAAFSAALAGVLTDPQRRARLGADGLERAGRFSWERTARMTLDVYGMAAELARRHKTTSATRDGASGWQRR